MDRLTNAMSSGKSRQKEGLRYGLYVPNFGKSSHPRVIAGLARDAEKNGWDGFFLWDHLVEYDRRFPIYDSFTSLAAIAASTDSIRIGTTISPLPRYKPWALARQTASLDHLSDGRMVLGVGLGAVESCDYQRFGEEPDNKVLAEKLDESLEIITGLWTGKPFAYRGKHFRMGKSVFLPAPVQRPRIPIWVGGFWPRKGPFKRAVRWDGTIPLRTPGKLPKPEDLREVSAYVEKYRVSKDPFDIVNIGWTTGASMKRNVEKVAPYREAGATWWFESLYTKRDSPEGMRSRIRKGPPRL